MISIQNIKVSSTQNPVLLKNKDLLLSLSKKIKKKTEKYSCKKGSVLPKPRKIPLNTKLPKVVYGTVNIKCAKRNIYLTLADSKNQIKATISTGYLKVKGKARKAIYFIKKLSAAFVQLILKSKFKRIHLKISGYMPRKIKRIFLKDFKSKKRKFKIYKFTRRLKSPHNGCRPRKMRRK